MSHAAVPLTRRTFGQTLRPDAWWVQPLLVFLILSGFIVFAQFMLFLAIGVMLWRYYELYPLAAPLATNDAVLPTFVVSSLTHGAAGFIVAAIVAAALSP